MAGAFEAAARVAIQEIIRNHAQESKFGLMLSKEAFETICDDLFAFLQTSRNLKAAGDRFIAAQMEMERRGRGKTQGF